MIILKQTNSQKLVTFFYGSCEKECDEFDLTNHADFFSSVYEFTETGFSRWFKDSGANYFTQLK